jgi:NH3-dependent NAD+ synthetase
LDELSRKLSDWRQKELEEEIVKIEKNRHEKVINEPKINESIQSRPPSPKTWNWYPAAHAMISS